MTVVVCILKFTLDFNHSLVRDMDVKEVAPLKIRERRVLKGHTAKIYSLAWAKDSTHLLSASQDGKLLVSRSFIDFQFIVVIVIIVAI